MSLVQQVDQAAAAVVQQEPLVLARLVKVTTEPLVMVLQAAAAAVPVRLVPQDFLILVHIMVVLGETAHPHP
jgi:hypothetical protein